MANVEIKIQAIVDKAIADINKTAGAVNNLDNSAKKAGGGVEGFASAMVGLNQALEVANKVMQAAKMIHDETVGVFIEYASQVRDMSRATGESAENSSRMIQMADDVGISYDKLKVSLQMAARQGIDTSVESLKKLSEEYLTLAPGTERMQFLLEKFGRSGADMGKLMEMGAAGIEKLNAGIEGGLILTDSILKQAKAHDILVDTYKDLVAAKKIAVGSSLGELESKAMLYGATSAQVAIMAQEQQAMEGVNWGRQEEIHWMNVHREEAEKQVLAMIDGKIAADESTDGANTLAGAQEDLALATEAAAQAQKNLQKAQESWNEGTANDVVAKLDAAGIKGRKYADALIAIDKVLGTNKKGENDMAGLIDDMIKSFKNNKDVDEFTTRLSTLQSIYLPQASVELATINTRITDVYTSWELLRKAAALPIGLRANFQITGSSTMLDKIFDNIKNDPNGGISPTGNP